MEAADGADKAAAGSVPIAQTFICAPGDASAAKPSERPFAQRGMPRAPRVTDLSRDAMPRRLNVRVSDGELEALDRASAEMGCSPSLPLHVANELIGISLQICSPVLLLLSRHYRTGICHS